MKNSQKGFIMPLLLVLVALLLVGGGVYAYGQKKKNQPAVSNLVQATSTTQTSDWKTYINTKYGFSLKYPDINARLKTVGGWTDNNEPIITSMTPFNYNECISAGEGPGMSGSKVIIAGREYCLITVSGVEPGTASVLYEYVSRIGNEDIGIVFEANFATGVEVQQQVNREKEAQSLFNQIISTIKFTN